MGTSGTQIVADSSQGSYSSGSDTLIGIQNDSSSPLTQLALSSTDPIFAFDGNGICTFAAGGSAGSKGFTGDSYCGSSQLNGTDPQDYQGPGNTFTGVNSGQTSGVITLTTPVAAGASTFFSLHGTLSATSFTVLSPTSVTTSLSGGGQIGTSIAVPVSTAVTDTATLAGPGASTAKGTVTYTAYSDPGCSTLVGTDGPLTITTPGTLPASDPESLSTVGYYYWKASYSGDSANAPSTTPCGSAGEVETVGSPPNKPTTLTTSLSGGGQTGVTVTVPSGTTVTDTATLAGTNAATASGSVTYTLYSDSGCTQVVGTDGPLTITTPGTLPPSDPEAVTKAGTYYWQASYSGDSANLLSTSTCGATGEVETVSSKMLTTTLTTSLSGGGQSGTTITVPTDTPVTDAATLAGTNAATAGGTVTYTAYSDSGCTTLVGTDGPLTVTTPGTLPASDPETLSTAGTYYWQASYSGDSTNAPSTSTCGSSGEVETVGAAKASTTLTTSLSGGGQTGTSITVPTGTPVTDTATLAGTNAASATGTVTYTAYSDAGCTTAVGSDGPLTITTPGTLPASDPETLSTAGTYYWQASYSGDSTNATSTSSCGTGDEVETVGSAKATTTLTTSLSGGGQSGTSISVPSGTAVTDAATLAGTNASGATGTVTYTAYSDSGCTKVVGTDGPLTITTPGTLPASDPETLSTAGTYYWQASYSGDSTNATSTSSCGTGDEVETVTTGSSSTTQPTKITTALSSGTSGTSGSSGSSGCSGSSCSWQDRILTVAPNTAVTDSATLTGTNAATAGGTVTYTVYSVSNSGSGSGGWGGWQLQSVATGGTVTVTDGVVPASKSVTLPTGIYLWQASYSGDSTNAASKSHMGSEVEIVANANPCQPYMGWLSVNCYSHYHQGNGNGQGNQGQGHNGQGHNGQGDNGEGGNGYQGQGNQGQGNKGQGQGQGNQGQGHNSQGNKGQGGNGYQGFSGKGQGQGQSQGGKDGWGQGKGIGFGW